MHCGLSLYIVKFRAVWFFSILVIVSVSATGQTEKYIQSLTGYIKNGDSCDVIDDKFSDIEKWTGIEKHLSVNNLITFEIRYDTIANYFNRNFSCRLLADIDYETADRTKQTLKDISLELTYDSAHGRTHRGIAVYKFKDAHSVKLTVKKITSAEWGNSIPPIFRIRNEIFVERLYILNTKTPVETVNVYNGGNIQPSQKRLFTGNNILGAGNREATPGQQTTINWDVTDFSFPQYDFEWTFYDDGSVPGSAINNSKFGFSPDELSAVFKNNNSRVTVSLPYYQLNLIYNSGWLFHRVRGVRYNEITGDRTEGQWSYTGNYAHNGNLYGLIRCDGHEQYLGWQYNRSFAEDGKSKEAVNYFDGRLRSRQAVTLTNDNSRSSAIVQEMIFDALGRPAVNVLPAPTEESTLHYFQEFNKSTTSGLPYQYADIEQQDNCFKQPAAMSTVSGASQYYSPANPRKDDNSSQFYFTKYIPDAQGYPFTVTNFTPDNTGRIRTQGGLGPVFQPGIRAPEHTTKYFYGKPQQDELDRLFGNEAGNASHYLKNMVTDANGQTSVAYINGSGKTVATALAGKSPDNLQTLPSYLLKTTAFITELTSRDNIVRDAANLSLTCSSTFLAAATGTFMLKYEFTPLSLQVLYGVENNKICADCYYDLLLNITDNCGNTVQSLNREAVFSEKNTCDPAPTMQEGELSVTIQQPGEYHITYKLTLSRKAIDYYLSQYLVQDLSIKTENDFQRDYLHKIDISGCFNNCEICLAELGTEQDFMNSMTGVLRQQNNIVPESEDSAWIKSLYKQLLNDCDQLQLGCGKTALPCEEQTLQLKEDVTLGGQYMLYDAVTKRFTERDINVFLKNANALTTTITVNGITKPFNQFDEATIIANWQNAWADILLPWHPENMHNCFIEDCGKNAGADVYDKQFLNTESAAVAATHSYWFGDDYLSVVNNDPYFKTGAEGASKKTDFVTNLANYKATGIDIMSFVRWSVYCQEKSVNGKYPEQLLACPRTRACNREEDEWTLFKTLYYSLKQEIKDKNKGCNSNNLFADPAGILLPGTSAMAASVACAPASLFDISNNNGTVAIQYTGTGKLLQDVTVQYFAVTNSGALAAANGKIVFPASTEADEIKNIPGELGLIYVIDNARCDLEHPYYTKTRRNYNGVNASALISQLAGKSQEELNANAKAAMVSECNESCEQLADGWMQKLTGCRMLISAAEYRLIRDGLTAVCKGSCQLNVQDHPFGASTTILPTKDGDNNFREVLTRVLGQSRFSAVCNDLLLDYPPPIGAQPLYANDVVRTLIPCAYDKLKAWTAAYQGATGYSSLSDYIQKNIDPVFSLTDAELNSLIAAYENNCITPQPIVLPSSLSCNAAQLKTCLTCAELKDEIVNFKTAYGFVSADDPDYYLLLAKFINRKYLFNLSSVDMYSSLQQCAIVVSDTLSNAIDCNRFKAAYDHFEQLKPGYFTNPNGNPNADSLYTIHLTQWLNTELHHQLSFDYYKRLATLCGIFPDYPGGMLPPACDTFATVVNCIPQFITCCGAFSELEKFRQVFPDSIDARLLALYFSFQRTQWCTPVNLPWIGYTLPYDTIVDYFKAYKLANNYNLIVRPDSLISYTSNNDGNCGATALLFNLDPAHEKTMLAYAVCNRPMQPRGSPADNDCISQQISVALGNAHSDYLEYMQKITRDYRNSYYSKCLSITPSLTLKALYDQPLEYHYTLYYYDQSGNLVKTIPPAGIHTADEDPDGAGKMLRIKNFRLADKDYCYEYGDAPAFTGNATIELPDNPAIQQTSHPFTIEAFINFSGLEGNQVILAKQSSNTKDNTTDGYKVYLSNGHLTVDIAAHGQELWTQILSRIVNYAWPSPYTGQPPVAVRNKVALDVPRLLYRNVTAQITSDIGGLISAGKWVYLAVQNTGDWSDPVRIYINGSLVASRLVYNKSDYTPADAPGITPAEMASGTTILSFNYSSTIVPLNVNNAQPANLIIGAASSGFAGGIKQVRLYNRALPASEIQGNAVNTCLVPQSEGQLVLWLPLNKEETAGISKDRINQLSATNRNTVFSDAYQPVYPAHKLATHYYYNSFNTITRQISPDGGKTDFFYDITGRLAASQNAEQKKSTRGEANNRYSYTRYDALGRITETGEKTGAGTLTATIAKTDPTVAGSPVNKWLASGTNIQVTQTIYDRPDNNIVNTPGIINNQNIYNTARKRIVATIYRNKITANTDYNSATHYQYDINGNVKRLWQEHKTSVAGDVVNLLKDLRYDYDLLSGKVNHILYQQEKGDQFIYNYGYDPDNRLLSAFSGRNMNTLHQDAGYQYYLHGPIARVELGDAITGRIVQGCDYAYTLQGWLKGVNGIQLAPASATEHDMGSDGSPLNKGSVHAQVAADELAYTLGYYQNDYSPVGGAAANALEPLYQHPSFTATAETGKELFNGNISSASYAIGGIANGHTRGYSYGYDQLNRLKEMRAHDIASVTTGAGWNNNSIFTAGEYRESFAYDANGNITKLLRNGTTAGGRKLEMDNLLYSYYYHTLNNVRKTYSPESPLPADAWSLTNQLAQVKDVVPATNYPPTAYPAEEDADSQVNDNYTYDEIGNLVADKTAGIKRIGWTVYGKIRSIDKSDGTSLLFDYDASGNRIQKQVIASGTKTITYYVRDAQGNTIAVYGWQGKQYDSPTAAVSGNGVTGQTWDEQHLYGSSRLGMWKPGITVPNTLSPTEDAIQVGSKFFELTNHLGNVLAVISDRKLAVPSIDNPLVTDHYTADLIAAGDYTPFGMQMVGRNYQVSASSYRYGFNGKEKDNEAKGQGGQVDYGMRVYDPVLGRFLSLDPLAKSYPSYTPYSYAGNKPVKFIDLDGAEEQKHWYDYDINDLMNWLSDPSNPMENDGFVHKATTSINRNFNPIFSLWVLATNKDYSSSDYPKMTRSDAAFSLTSQMILHKSLPLATAATPAVQMEKQMLKNKLAAETPTNSLIPKASEESWEIKNTTIPKPRQVATQVQQWQGSAGGINPKSIHFSQRTVNGNVDQYINDMKANRWDWNKSGPIRIMEMDGKMVSYDNRRLMAAQQAELQSVPYSIVYPGDLMPGSNKTWQEAFTLRFNDIRNIKAGGVIPSGGLKTQPKIK